MGLSTYSIFKKMVLDNEDIHMLSQEEVEQVQRVLLDMMDDIHAVCEKNGLMYVLSGGCALGAVRHGGFIPWDDDIDVCMPRRDYDQFRDFMIAEYGDKYYVQEIRSCEDYDLNFMKVRLNGTVFAEFLEPEPEKAGIFIDIFPVENVYDNPLRRKMQWILSDGLQFVCSCVRIHKKKKLLLLMAGDDKKAAETIRTKARLGAVFGLVPFRKWLLVTESYLSRNGNEHTRMVSIPTGGRHFRGETYPRKWMFPPKKHRFADRQYYFMPGIRRYLRQMYGDYMKIPPESERERHALRAFSLPECTE